jgi:hypothetical protein
MIVARANRTVVAWIACLAILLASLAPAISQAVQRGVPDAMAEVCSAMGFALAAADQTTRKSVPAAPAVPAKHLLQHCPYCSLHVTVLGMPPAPPSVPALVPVGIKVPELLLAAPRTLFAWAVAQPRAPPRLS